MDRIRVSGEGGVKVGKESGATGESWTRGKNSDFLALVRMIIIMFMDLVPGATGQLISSLSPQYSCHSLNEYLLKIDDNGHMESLRAYLGYGSLEHNW